MDTRFNSNSRYKSRNIRKSFFYQISLLELIMAFWNFIKCSLWKGKKNQQKDSSYLKSNKNSSNSKRYKKNIEKRRIKNEKYKKSLTAKIKFFTFIFHAWKRIYFARKHNLVKWSLYHYISSKVSFCVEGY